MSFILRITWVIKLLNARQLQQNEKKEYNLKDTLSFFLERRKGINGELQSAPSLANETTHASPKSRYLWIYNIASTFQRRRKIRFEWKTRGNKSYQVEKDLPGMYVL